MPITLATLGKLRYFPELIPDASVASLVGGAISPPVLDLRGFAGYSIRLNEITVAQDGQVEMRVQADSQRHDLNLGAVQNYQPLDFDSEALSYLSINFRAQAGKANWRTLFSVWVNRPTVAHKIARGVPLDQDEQQIADTLGLADTVQKGLLPLPIAYQVEREYVATDGYPVSLQFDLSANTPVIVKTEMPRENEVIVLTSLACDPGGPADGVKLTVNRDDDYSVVEMPAYPMVFDRDVPCWIPARKRLWIVASSTAAVLGWRIRYTIRVCRLTNLLRARWGLATKDQLPGDVWDKVRGGVL